MPILQTLPKNKSPRWYILGLRTTFAICGQLYSIPTVLSTYMANTTSIYWTTAVLVRNLKIGVFYGTGRRIPVQPHSYMR